MTKLLISVRNAIEARIALEAGVDLIDIKEPRRGALGAADLETIQDIANTVGERVPLSAALGELADWATAAELLTCLPASLAFAKFGLAGCVSLPDWQQRWCHAFDMLPIMNRPEAPLGRVAVAYADWVDALAPPPHRVLEHAISHGASALLLDTHDKRRGPITAHLSLRLLRELIDGAARHGILSVIAGSLARPTLEAILQLQPDFVGIRGAACVGERAGTLNADRVRALCDFVKGRESSFPADSPHVVAAENY